MFHAISLFLTRVNLLHYPGSSIDPIQKWLPLNYSFVRIQNSLNFCLKNEVSETILNKIKI